VTEAAGLLAAVSAGVGHAAVATACSWAARLAWRLAGRGTSAARGLAAAVAAVTFLFIVALAVAEDPPRQAGFAAAGLAFASVVLLEGTFVGRLGLAAAHDPRAVSLFGIAPARAVAAAGFAVAAVGAAGSYLLLLLPTAPPGAAAAFLKAAVIAAAAGGAPWRPFAWGAVYGLAESGARALGAGGPAAAGAGAAAVWLLWRAARSRRDIVT
jgi:hypothetical protein